MQKGNYILSFHIIFLIELLSLLVFINSFSIYILDEAKEKEATSKNTLVFTLKGGLDEAFYEDKKIKIQGDLYKDDEFLKKNYADCTIPSSPNADFGTSISINCEMDLLSSPGANKIKFTDFIINDPMIKINDLKNYVIGKTLSFTRTIDSNANYEFTAKSIKSFKCIDNKISFGIDGEINKYFIKGFTFNLTLNDYYYPIKAKCDCPGIYFSSEVTVNCTITILNNDNKFIDGLKRGIELKENYYKTVDTDGEKLLKLKIKSGDMLEYKDINCDSNNNNYNSNYEENNRKSNRGNNYQYDNENRNTYKDEQDEIANSWERQRKEEERRKKEQEERQKEEEKRKRDQEDLEKFLRDRQKKNEEKEKEKDNWNRYNDYDKKNENSYFDKKGYESNNNNDDIIDYNSKVKLLHLQIRYSYGFIYYMFYALSPVPLGHKIKARFSITKYNYNTGYNDQENKYIILKTENEINTNDKNLVIEYLAKYDCQDCKKIILDKNSIEGAKIYNIPDDQYRLDAIATNQNNYFTRSNAPNPPLYVTDNLFSQNCMLYLGGGFFNKNKFFPSKFALNLISTSYYGSRGNVTIYCGINERGIFACPIDENLNNFQYKLEPFIIDQKENIIIDNSNIIREGMITCQKISGIKIDKSNEIKEDEKKWSWKRISFAIIIIGIIYYVISKYYCQKEEEQYSDEYNPRWRVSSSNYGGGESYGLRSQGW